MDTKKIAGMLTFLIATALFATPALATDVNLTVNSDETINLNTNLIAPIVNAWINGVRFGGASGGINMQYVENLLISGLYWTMGAEEDWRGFSIQDESKAFGTAMYQFIAFHFTNFIEPYESRIRKLEWKVDILESRVKQLMQPKGCTFNCEFDTCECQDGGFISTYYRCSESECPCDMSVCGNTFWLR